MREFVIHKIYQVILQAGYLGRTDDELEYLLGIPHQTASALRRGLVKNGKVEDSRYRRRTRSGRNAIIWVATGLDELS